MAIDGDPQGRCRDGHVDVFQAGVRMDRIDDGIDDRGRGTDGTGLALSLIHI